MTGGGGRPTSAHFDTTDPEAAEDFIRAVHVDPHMRLVGGREHFRFVHATSGAACAGTLGVAVNRIASSTPLELDTAPLDDLLIVTLVRAGRLDYRPGDAGLAAVSARPGSVVLAPTSGGTAVSMAPGDGSLEVETVVLGLAETARHAAVCGTAPASLRFTGLAPVDRAAALRWTRLVAHVRDEVLAVPAVTENPLAVAGASRPSPAPPCAPSRTPPSRRCSTPRVPSSGGGSARPSSAGPSTTSATTPRCPSRPARRPRPSGPSRTNWRRPCAVAGRAASANAGSPAWRVRAGSSRRRPSTAP